ncbi:MAG: hypothetical protein CV088_21970 [Nitrospira sp. LK70]|nr:hypothetical protein [Nitrospira sp. LK70]
MERSVRPAGRPLWASVVDRHTRSRRHPRRIEGGGTKGLLKCETQAEIDEIWDKLSHGGEPGPCGWLKNRYGLSWQIVSPEWGKMLRDKDPKRSERVMEAILHMTKPDLQKIGASGFSMGTGRALRSGSKSPS